MYRIKDLMERCKASVSITINAHKDNYISTKEELKNRRLLDEDLELDPDIEAKMIEMDRIVDIHFYPDTPIGFYSVLHYDLDKALDEAMEVLSHI